MSVREWKSGDLAVLADGQRAIVDRAGRFVYGWGDFQYAKPGSISARDARPLVVIDPEDADAVERFLWSIDAACVHHFEDKPSTQAEVDESIPAMQTALREFANPTPPKPEEPIGHLAIVEDCDGIRWVNWRDPRDGLEEHERAWHSTQMDTDEWRDYANIAAVRVLSEGVS